MKIVIYGLSITSSWGNGHATTYRSLCRELARRGHEIHFVEKSLEWYRSNADLPEPEFCKVHLYERWSKSARELLQLSHDADAIVVGSYFPDAIAATYALLNAGRGPLLFYDIDTPITLSALRQSGATSYLNAALIPNFDCYLTFTGGPVLRELETVFGAQRAAAFYCSVDPEIHRPTTARAEYRCDLSYLGTFAHDRHAKLMQLLNEPAARLRHAQFIVAGAQYPESVEWKRNVKRIIHLSPPEHPSFYSSSRFTLNLTRSDMVQAGYSPSVRLFEASACGAAILSDQWHGLDEFLTPNEEILVPRDAYEVGDILLFYPEDERRRMGLRARERILAHHTAAHRAAEFEEIVASCSSRPVRKRKKGELRATGNTSVAEKSEVAQVSMDPMPQP
jgi:spore maturation protein CgeB